jgi:hypothetical protein
VTDKVLVAATCCPIQLAPKKCNARMNRIRRLQPMKREDLLAASHARRIRDHAGQQRR